MGNYSQLFEAEAQKKPKEQVPHSPLRVEQAQPLSPPSQPPVVGLTERANASTTERANDRTGVLSNASTTERANDRTPERRSITRYSFEFYLDQIETLKKLSLQAKLRGEKGSMSEMIRDAVDRYIAGHKDNEKP